MQEEEQIDVDSNKDFDSYFDEFAGKDNLPIDDKPNDVQPDDIAIDGAENESGLENDDLTPVDQKDRQLSEALAQIEQLRRDNETLEHSFNSQKGRVSALQKKIDSPKQEAQEFPDEITDDPDDNSIENALELFPEIVKPLLKAFEKERLEMKAEFDSQLNPIRQQEQARYIEHQAVILDNKIPEWRDVVNSKEYSEWLDSQHEAVRQLKSSIHANDYEYLVGSFLNTRSKRAETITKRRQADLSANVSVKNRGPSKLSSAPEDFESAWDYYASKK